MLGVGEVLHIITGGTSLHHREFCGFVVRFLAQNLRPCQNKSATFLLLECLNICQRIYRFRRGLFLTYIPHLGSKRQNI